MIKINKLDSVHKKIEALRRHLEGQDRGAATPARAVLPLGLPAIDAALPRGGLPLAALHEMLGVEGDGAAAGFVAVLLARLERPVAWVAAGTDLYGLGLHGLGLDPARLILIEAPRPRDRLWAFEELLRSRGLAGIAAEIDRLDLTATRRLQLAAETSGAAGFLLRGAEAGGASAARTRWRITALASTAGLGIGPPRWRVELLRCRSGRPGAWTIAWDGKEGWHEQPESLPGAARDRGVAAASGDRPAGAEQPIPFRRSA